MPNGVDLGSLRPPDASASGAEVVFCGVMNYEPNVEGVLWFARDVWPIIVGRQPNARFRIVGSSPSRAIRQLAEKYSSITVTGTVPDVRTYLWNAAVSVAPLKIARGLQNKVLEALAAGLPVVVTSTVMEGLPDEAHAGCSIANDADAFAEETLALLALSGAERRRLASRADLTALSWESQLRPLLGILEDAASHRRQDGR
jgi:glycosyltransferase involved in cell wall biosynthesis